MVRFRRSPTVEDAQRVDQWTLLHGRHAGREIAVRRNSNMDNARDRTDYAFQICVEISVLSADDRGFPSAIENERLFEIEDDVAQIAGGSAVFVAALTSAGIRELMLYSKTDDWVAPFQRELARRIRGHRFRVMTKEDPTWSTFMSYASIT